jgi:hypothetical protein
LPVRQGYQTTYSAPEKSVTPLKAGLFLGGPPGWKNRPGYSLFLGPEEPALIKMGAKSWLGSLAK